MFALVVDAKDEAAEAFYRHHGFERFGTKARQLIVALKNFAHEADIWAPNSNVPFTPSRSVPCAVQRERVEWGSKDWD